MKKTKRFLLRLSEDDLQTLVNVAEHLDRSKSDAVRWALREVGLALENHPENLRLLGQVKRPR